MMLRRVVLSTAVLWLAGCYSPKLSNFGFACDPTAVKPCPDGYFCRGGYCDDGSGGMPPAGTGGNGGDQDMAMDEGGGGSGGGGGGGGSGGDVDMAMSMPHDMAMPAPPDMAKAPPDMTKPPSTCAHDPCTTGGKLSKTCDSCVTDVCTADSYCCSTTWDSTCVSEYKQACPGTC